MSTYPAPPEPAYTGNGRLDDYGEKPAVYGDGKGPTSPTGDPDHSYDIQDQEGQGQLQRKLQGRHMQMIAIGRIQEHL